MDEQPSSKVPCEDCGQPLDRMGVHAQTCGEQRPSKELASRLRYCALCNSTGEDPAGGDCRRCGGSQSLERLAADELERLQRQVEELSIHAEKWVKRALEFQLANAGLAKSLTYQPEAYYAALNRLSLAMGNPALGWKDGETIESALLDEAARRLSKPAHEREPPHCASCSCHVPLHEVLSERALIAHANAYDQGPGATFEYDQTTLLAMLRSLAATVEGMVRDGAGSAAITSRTVDLTDDQRQMLTARGIDEIPSHDESQCWEPCGELGKSAEHARLAPEPAAVQDDFSDARDLNHDDLMRKLPNVRPELLAEIKKLSPWALQRRVLIQADWLGSYSKCLDGLKLREGVDGCWNPRDIRAAAENLRAAQPPRDGQ